MSWPTQEYDSFLFTAQKMANPTQSVKTTRDRIATSPTSGKFNVFFPQPLNLLLKRLYEA